MLTSVMTVAGTVLFPKKKPGAHRHSASATRATAVVLVLTGHALHVALPSAGLYLPRAHGAHAAEVLAKPASHAHASTLDAFAGSGTRECAGHAAHASDVWLRKRPSGHETHDISKWFDDSACAAAPRAPHSHAPHTASTTSARRRRRREGGAIVGRDRARIYRFVASRTNKARW